MTYRSLTYFFIVPAVTALGFAACSGDPDEPYSGAPSGQAQGQPRNADGPLATGVDADGNVIEVSPSGSTEEPANGATGPMSGALGATSGILGVTSGILGVTSGSLGDGSVGDGSAGDGSVDEGACDVMVEVFQASCDTANCHGAGSTIGDFAASEASALDLIDQSTVLNAANCGLFIDTANPLESAIWTKTLDPQCGGQAMPPGGPPLNASQRACLQSWLESL